MHYCSPCSCGVCGLIEHIHGCFIEAGKRVSEMGREKTCNEFRASMAAMCVSFHSLQGLGFGAGLGSVNDSSFTGSSGPTFGAGVGTGVTTGFGGGV